MDQEPDEQKNTPRSNWSCIAIGVLMFVYLHFFDPIGSNPDTGIISLSPANMKKFLQTCALFFIAAGVWGLCKNTSER